MLGTAMSIAVSAYAAEDAKDPYEDSLLGHWGGLRDKMSNVGIEPTIEYKADIWSVTSGGKRHDTVFNDNLDIKFEIDNEKLLGIKGNRAMISFLNNNGGEPNAHGVGSVQGIDNIETSTNTFKLYELWSEQSFFNDKLAVLLGVHDLNSEFDVTDMSANFLKPTMQIGQAFAQSGKNGPSIFPNTSLAARVKVKPTQNTYLSAAAFDGVPGNPDKPHGTHIELHKKDGLLLISEAGITPKAPEGTDGEPNKLAIGGWTYTEKADDLVDVDGSGNPTKKRSAGAYMLSSYQFYTNTKTNKNAGAFFRAGIADSDTVQVDWDYELGLVGRGWVPTRADGEIGVGMSQSHNGDKYMQSVSGAADRNEYSYELYYRDTVVNGLSVQPDLQYVVNPGTDQVTKDATVVGIRFDVNL